MGIGGRVNNRSVKKMQAGAWPHERNTCKRLQVFLARSTYQITVDDLDALDLILM
jgi:hypothetical protein